MGGLSYGLHMPFNINFSNPASYTDLLLTTFELGANATFLELKNTVGKGQADDVSFGYFSLGFPVKMKKWGMSLGLLPYSNVGYTITQEGVNEVGDKRNLLFTGEGGLNQFYLGNAVALGKGYTAGVNASFMFGTINQQRRLYYPDGGYRNARITEENVVNDFYFTFGLQKTFDSLVLAKSDSLVMFEKDEARLNDSIAVLNKAILDLRKDSVSLNPSLVIEGVDSQKVGVRRDKMMGIITSLAEQQRRLDSLSNLVVKRKQRSGWSLTLGLTGAPSMHLRGKRSSLVESYGLTPVGNEYVYDTILNEQSRSGRLVMPLSLGFGFAMKKGSKWLAGADFSMQNWQDYSFFGQSDSLANSWRVAVGGQFVPNDRSIKSYLALINYRLGFHYEQTYLNLNGSQLSQIGVSMGLGIPVKRSASMIHVSVEAGKRGTTSNKLVEENYIKCSLGFTLNDRWFVKTKID